ncbi:hypothetical protein [Nitriliruptor alkaliphilus]|uniref:hypothetical protein n=1 Tax=Nitriliruptor alkaliphilus TaxID=427918 RepID=UPI0006980F9F|nr:hypothetical protein [Nitriliruptor alkaliphilus]
MADQPPAGVPARAAPPAETEDPLAADRRTLVIGASSMVGLILVGVVSAQLFARGGCDTIVTPEPAAPVATAGAPEDVIDEQLGPVDGARAVDILEQAAGAPVVAAIPVGDATRVAALGDGLVTTGGTVTSFDRSLTPIATFSTGDPVVGDGDTVYDLALASEVTGHIDAFVPLIGTDLDVGTCVDTALVGSPFAFLLDAGDGELLLLRAEEDGDAPDLQLWDPEEGARWDQRLTLTAGPPGTLAERLTARLGPGTVVATRRVGPQEEVGGPALVAITRADGTERFAIDGEVLAGFAELDPADPIRWEVAAVGHDTVLVHGRPDPQDAPETGDGEGPADGSLVLLDLADGSPLTAIPGVGPVQEAAADLTDPAADDRYAIAVGRGEGRGADTVFLTADGTSISLGSLIDDARFAWVDDAVVVAGRDSLSRLTPTTEIPTVAVLVGGRFADVTLTADGRVAALVTARDGGDAVLLVTTPTDVGAADA